MIAYAVDDTGLIHRNAVAAGVLVIPKPICGAAGGFTMTEDMPTISDPDFVCVPCFPAFHSTGAAVDPQAWPDPEARLLDG